MYNNKQLLKRAGFMLALTLLLLGNKKGMAQFKYNLQITKGYAVSEDWDVNGSNLDLSLNRKIWSVISMGIYYSQTSVDNLKARYNANYTRQNANGFFIPPSLDQYIKSLDISGSFNFYQDIATFTSMGLKTNFDFKMSSKFKAGFYVGLGLTQRKTTSMILSEAVFDNTTGLIIDYTPASLFLKATEFSSRYGLKFSYVLSPKFNLILQAGHNTSSFKKYSYGRTSYTIINLGVAFKL